VRPWLATIVVLSVIGSSASSQQPPEQPAQPPTFRTEANYVRVDAYLTDKDGSPVMDLDQNEFEILENGVPQKIEQFERVQIRANLPQEMRREPNTVEAGRQAAQNPRARVFVIFLDYNHVGIDGSHRIRQPLVNTLNRLIGPEDLFAVMTPEMSARDIAFARRTTTIEGFLARYWTWGERNQTISTDPVEDEYKMCYPGVGPTPQCKDDDRGVADAMMERRKEKLTIDALDDLIQHLQGVREERKAVLLISEGWRLFRPDPTLARQLACQVPGTRIGIDPRTSKPTSDPVAIGRPGSTLKCERDRQNLAAIDDEDQFRRMLDAANRANTSFYPVEPRGLVVFDEPISKPSTGRPPPGSTTLTPPSVDQARLTARHEALRTLAGATDGRAILDSNDLERGFKRVVDDLSSYYLLGYYSSGKLDGRFHAITVRVKRPGVQVRARRGYLAATAGAVTASSTAASTPAPVPAETLALQAALGSLAEFQREAPLRVHVASGWRPRADGSPAAAFWIVGEIGAGVPTDRDIDVTLLSPSGSMVGRGSGQPNGRSALIAIAPSTADAGEYTVRVRADGAAGTGIVKIALRAAPDAGGAVFFRRGPTTGNREVPTADLRFRRSERIRVNLPTVDTRAVEARLLDRTGKALAIPMTAAVRDESDGSRWQSTELALAPLAPGDYVIELVAGRAGGAGEAGGEMRTLIAFRVIP
jgi:VWFA-related protein